MTQRAPRRETAVVARVETGFSALNETVREIAPRRIWALCLLWTAFWSVLLFLPTHAMSWGVFRTAGRLLVSAGARGGLHLFHYYPQFQIGPLAAIAALPLDALPYQASKVAAAVLLSVQVLPLYVLLSSPRMGWPWLHPRRALLITAGLLAPVWAEIASATGHLDDALALSFGLLGLVLLRTARPGWAAIAFALATDAKPWALPFAAALLALPRARWRGVFTLWAAMIAVVWLPFVVADPATLGASSYRIAVANASVLRLFGIHGQTPAWCRPAQLVVALMAAARLGRRGRTGSIILAVVAVRLLLDPAAASYYTTGAMLGALVADRCRRHKWPWLSIATAILLWLPVRPDAHLLAGQQQAWLRLMWCALVLGALLLTAELPPRRMSRTPAGRPQPHVPF